MKGVESSSNCRVSSNRHRFLVASAAASTSCPRSSGSSVIARARPKVPNTGLPPWLLLLLEDRRVDVLDLLLVVSSGRGGSDGGGDGAVARRGKLGRSVEASDLGALSGSVCMDERGLENDGTGSAGCAIGERSIPLSASERVERLWYGFGW